MLKLRDDILTLPKVLNDDDEINFDLKNISSALSRQEEVAIVTQDKAPELMGAFLKGFSDSTKYVAAARYSLNKAKIMQKRTHAILAKDKVPDMLKEARMKDTKANVDMFVCLDPEFQKYEELATLLDAVVEDLEGKSKALESLYQAVKKVYGNSYQPMNYSMYGNESLKKKNELDDRLDSNIPDYTISWRQNG